MADYHRSLHEAVWEFPLSAVAALHPAIVHRHGGRVADYVDKALIRARHAEGARLRRVFNIVDDPK